MKRLKLLLIAAASVALASCGTDEPIYDTPHPTQGKITLTTDWSKIGEGITKPASYTIEIGGQKVTATADKYTIDNLFDAGTYRIYAYNTAEHITVADGVATVAITAGVVAPMPGWLFSASDEVEIKKDTHHEFTATMIQQVRQLNIELTVTDGDINSIESITASLSGVANAMNLKDGTYSGTGLKVAPVFTKSGNKLIASVRLIGITSEAQNLTLDINYTSGLPQQVTSDVSSKLTGFGTDKHIPLTLTGNISITSSGIGVNFDSEISGWETQGDITIDPNEQ
ncbi:hypothetical protein F050043D4_47260 [Bacteroides thetaiotaomicron]|jgi:hypothetical protein|uniref:FimB/Mfa2 family fimbrial subunit n=1 Tax=Bacteroides thetaiotaomicron TaxID=818 RepID=UPI00101B6407|nr:FimB/Mfa2 family fimbrial subunit [Parabacteroides goldsteinii]